MGSYLSTIDLDARKVLERLRRVREELQSGGAEQWRDLGILFALMTPEQRDTFRRMQSLMSVLEGHGNFVMDRLANGRVGGADRMRRILQQRRHRQGFNRMVQRAVGLDVKARQYDLGERFVAQVVDRAGPDGFARIWERSEHLPSLEEVGRPEAWIERVAAA
jgi:putative hydrolase